ncbi:MAG: hypothetical protein ABI039_04745 [Vicinamibacterales bacterium]
MQIVPALAFCVVVLTSSLVAAAPGSEARLRPQDARLTSLLRQGAARSTTFKALVDRIEASHVIVYVAINPLMKAGLAGMVTWMTRAGDYRYLRASISTDLTPDQMIATLAHELQHAVEVIEDESVTDEASLVALYRRIGRQSGSSGPMRWETVAAQETGFKVRRELVSAPPSTVAGRADGTRS